MLQGLKCGKYENGQKHWEIEWKNDKIHGIYKWWYSNGQKMYDINYILFRKFVFLK